MTIEQVEIFHDANFRITDPTPAEAGARLDELASTFAQRHSVDYSDGLQMAIEERPRLAAAYLHGSDIESAGDEVDRRVQAFMEKHEADYETALMRILDDDPELAERYNG